MTAEEYVKHYASGQGGYESVPVDIALRAIEYAKRETKQQMMANAADMVVGYWMPNGLMLTVDETENCYNIDEGDRVKVIVIKEDKL